MKNIFLLCGWGWVGCGVVGRIYLTNIRGFGATHHQHFEDNFFSAQRNIYSFQFLHLWSNFEICFFQKGPTTFLPFVITIYILQFLFFNLITSPILRKVIFFQFRCTLTTSKVEFPLHWCIVFCHYTFFRGSWYTFFLLNRIGDQKLNQTTPYGAFWLSFWCSTRPSADPSNWLGSELPR